MALSALHPNEVTGSPAVGRLFDPDLRLGSIMVADESVGAWRISLSSV